MEPRLKEYILLAVWSLALFASCYWLDTRHNRFPYYYHPDERGKVEQIITSDWNFHHPMLLLTTTKIYVELTHVQKKEQPIVEAGRRVSAMLMGAAVVALSLLAFLWRGWAAAICAGFTLMLHHQLYELAHYMKEDSALLFGVACTFLAALAYSQTPSWWRVLILGASAGLAISGKYIGIVVVAAAAPVVWIHSERARFSRLMLFLLAMIVVIVAVNLPLLLHPGAFEHSLNREMDLAIEGQRDVTRRVPHALYWNVFIDNSTPLLWLFLVSFLVVWWHRQDSLSLAQKLIVAFPFGYALILSFSPKENDRYFLPATALLTFIAALGTLDAPRLVQRVLLIAGLQHPERAMSGLWRWRAVAISIAGLTALQITGWAVGKPGWLSYDAAFQHDDKADLIAWMQAKLPPDAVVAADSATGLADPKRKKNSGRSQKISQTLLVSRLAADLGSIDELRAQGVTYVIVSESSYGRFFRADLRAKDSNDRKFSAARSFYEFLLREEPVFERERGTVIYLHPGIRVYSIADGRGA